MPRVTQVKAARKDYPNAGIKKGEPYYWWKFRYGPKRMSKTHPTRQQLTQSDFLSSVYDLEDRIGDLKADGDLEGLRSEVESIMEDIRSLGEEQGEKKDNMPEGLQEGPTGELLQGRADSCEGWADNVEGVDLDLEPEEGESKEDFQSRIEDAVGEIQSQGYDGE